MMARAVLSAFTLTPGSSPGQALGSRLRGNDGGARERGRRALFFSGFPPARERRSVLGLKEQQIRRYEGSG